MEEKNVFIAGSRSLSRLGKEIESRLDNMVARGMRIFVGDANGADKTIQKYLNAKHYENVVIFCMDSGCRNNLGRWPTRVIQSASTRKDFAHFSTKDRAMAREADYGLMLWDGESRGTFTNILDLMKRDKVVVVYLSTDKHFYNLKQLPDLQSMLKKVNPTILDRVSEELVISDDRRARKASSLPRLF